MPRASWGGRIYDYCHPERGVRVEGDAPSISHRERRAVLCVLCALCEKYRNSTIGGHRVTAPMNRREAIRATTALLGGVLITSNGFLVACAREEKAAAAPNAGVLTTDDQ